MAQNDYTYKNITQSILLAPFLNGEGEGEPCISFIIPELIDLKYINHVTKP